MSLPLRSLCGRSKGFACALCFGLAFLMGIPGPAAGQGKASGTYLVEAFTRVTNNAGLAGKLVGFGYAENLSILGGWVDAGKSLEFDLNHLVAGTQYMIIAAGDKDAEDVDLEIIDPAGKVVASDVRTAPDAIVAFTPQVKGRHTMRLTLFKSRQSVPCVCVATILKKGGWNIPLRTLDDPVGRLVRALAAADQEVQKTGKRLDLHKAPNQWALYGGVARQGEDVTVTNMTLGRGLRLFLGVGDKSARDVDLFLLDNNGKTIVSDTRVDPVAVFTHEPGAGPHGLRVLNFDSNGPSLLIMGIFEVR